ncbi:ferrichrome transport system permease protein FhuB [Photobacterium sp. SKA34]|uniref:Fe(3+)-hydroxamate ABC transporter permease FhuB n=1 Tax=Photobacterium sp. SKA34 TaxID=121723 RepID=UPI00006B89C5|nr:Fe(3+)-hydroxamate ABC transporter permease FhuB [Photobacterium sp. SKA34]EAR55199.1 ferrichrome transport system permease protein FhuB [Photobacterium sp. SKA34]
MTSKAINNKVKIKTSNIGLIVGVIITTFLVSYNAPYSLSFSEWISAIFSPNNEDYRQLIVHYSFLPRLSIALVCGAGLAAAGSMMQYVLRNPLASPMTLGVAAGSELGVLIGTLFIPSQLQQFNFVFAFIGGLFATGLVFLLSARKGFSPFQLVLSGMVVSLFIGSLNMMLLLVNENQLTSVFIWGAGALDQTDWSKVQLVTLLIGFPWIALFLLIRPLSILQLGESIASAIGVRVIVLRVLALSLSVFITSSIVSQVGIIGFVGLVAPVLAKMLGARKLFTRLVLSTFLGAAILLFADLCSMIFSNLEGNLLPTGAVTALIGSPFLIWIIHRNTFPSSFRAEEQEEKTYVSYQFKNVVIVLACVGTIVFIGSLTIGKSALGWLFTFSNVVYDLRLPRALVAFFVGVALALAGTIIQRITRNGMASPEVLGVSAGSALALVLVTLLGFHISRTSQLLVCAIGALLVISVIGLTTRKEGFSPAKVLLTGIGLSAGLDAIIRIAMASGQDNVKGLLNWMSGSTYLASLSDFYLIFSVTGAVSILLILCHRWLDIIALGDISACSVGVPLKNARKVLFLLAAILTAVATIVMGPLSFIGLLAPHMARSLGQYQSRRQLIVASIVGGNIMMLADWAGRNIWFPWQFPAGLLASVIGGAYFIYLIRK